MENLPLPQIHSLFDLPFALYSLIDELPLGVVVHDLERRILLFNRALEGLCGFSREESWGVPCRDVVRSNICLQQCAAAMALQSGEPVSLEGNIINRDRQKIAVRLTAIPLKDAADNLVGFLETIEDIRLLQELDQKIHHAYRFSNLLGRSPQMEELFRIMPVVAQTDSSVLVTGETGTGKDFVAEAIHQASKRAKGPFIKVNCGALPETLLESEIFGHKKGAFTGAVEDKPGRFRLAHNGTLYLTEIGDLPLALQVKLLTFLDDKVVYPLGSTKGFQADVRVIAATHRDLQGMVREGRFREDLLFRLNVVRLQLPPLRERGGDAALLLDHFLHLFAARFEKRIQRFAPEARQTLLDYAYPGNVRELRNIVEYATNICQDDEIKPEHLPAYLTEPKVVGREHPDPQPPGPVLGELQSRAPAMNWSSLERQLIMEALIQSKGRRSKAAAMLGWGRSTLWRKMKHYGIES